MLIIPMTSDDATVASNDSRRMTQKMIKNSTAAQTVTGMPVLAARVEDTPMYSMMDMSTIIMRKVADTAMVPTFPR